MFPALLIQPEVSLASFWVFYIVLSFGALLKNFKKLLSLLSFVFILLTPYSANAAMYVPGKCGSWCFQTWGTPTYPSVYYGNYSINPYAFYNDPFAYYRMLTPWYGAGPFPNGSRSIQSIE